MKKKTTGSNYNKYKETLSLRKKNTAVLKNLQYTFRCLGLTLDKTGGGSSKTFRESNERYANWEVTVLVYPQQVRLALDGLAYDTALPIDDSIFYLRTIIQ